ncbi:BMP family protein [Paenactinomyces guangxiensis]|uniref:BMP family ABC transporter substrate-binding protein n=1 Tax=Paenactinomyces guangxiensis TaxID=1490290 RepID=A0A7W1WQV1_9BACL|nr:BMP family ABC transporter substrate-binding protein [Paenactinomyces guangxiensis]MBA4494395.1 BMP family ABC transporter substrate-binding protein [Paenactinomyces guangxiensis]MBH8591550.1 BMP family ABC transporter substrate-binding protein [Paenactinomyces guangxiensis]
MAKKSWIALILSAVFILAVGCNGQQQGTGKGEGGFKVGMVTDTGGLNDESFNQTAWEGIKRTKSELDADIKALESKRDEDYVPNLTKFAREGRDITWAVGFKFEKSIPDVAKRFPDAQFGIVDTNLGGKIPENVTAVTFKEEEGSFLMGVIAGLTTKTNKVGFIGGISSPLIKKFESGFRAGVHAANPNVTVQVAYAESFTDATKGRSLAQNMYNSGIDVIFHASGGVGKGLFDEVKTREKGKYWAIGVDMDQSSLAPDHTLSSLIKRVDVAVFDITKELKEGKLKSGKEVVLGLKEGGVDIAENSGKHVSPDVLKKVDEFKQKIINGEIKVPKNEDELKQFLAK